jgi:glycosyltransferase involved in cell wall biosynthesis
LILTPGFPTLKDKNKADGNNSFYGGSFVKTEAMAYCSAGARVTVLTPHVPGLPLKEKVSNGFDIVRFRYFLPTRWQKVRIPKLSLYTTKYLYFRIFQFPLFVLFFFCAIFKYIKKVDIIHTNWTPTALLALPYKFLFDVPIVLTYRGSDLRMLPETINRFIIRHVNGAMGLGGGVHIAKYWRKAFPKQHLRLPLLTKTPDEKEIKSIKRTKTEKTQILFLGRLVVKGVRKGADVIIPATNILRNRYTSFTVNILGDGPDRALLEKQYQSLGVEAFIQFHGYRKDAFPFILNSDAVIGGVGLNAVCQECALCKALLILPDVPEVNGGIWRDKENAILYELHNPESMAEAMAYVIEHPERRKEIALNGYDTIRKYAVNYKEGGKLYIRAFQDICGKSLNEE